MSLILHLKDIEEVIYSSDNHVYVTDRAGTQEFFLNYDHKFFKGCFNEIVLPNFKISYGNSYLRKNTTILFESYTETVEMHFTINGSSSTYIKGFDKDIGISNSTHNIFYGNDAKGKMKWNSNEMFVFEINFNPTFFKNYLPKNSIFNEFKRKIENKQLGVLSEHNHTITPQMLMIIQQIINCNFKDEFRRMFLEAKVLDLLLLQLEQIQACSSCYDEKKIIKEQSDLDKMYFIKELIDKNLFDKLTLSQLSNEIQSNECTLKKEFKSTFNTTVFSYIKEQRMQKAKQMLMNSNKTINEISDTIGYKNPQHFTTAFKKYFGYVPSVLLKS